MDNNPDKGWTVTVAGTYDDLAPDVQMRLSFPKRTSSQCSRPDARNQCQQIAYANEELHEFEALDNFRNDNIELHQSNMKGNILPDTLQGHSMKFNPKRSLSKNYYGPGIITYFDFIRKLEQIDRFFLSSFLANLLLFSFMFEFYAKNVV